MYGFSQLLFAMLYCISHSVYGFDTLTCGSAKTCILNPPGCSTSDANCAGFSYAYDPEENIFNMELSGGIGLESSYVAVAFSPDGRMRNSDLYFCNGVDVKSGIIHLLHNEPTQDVELPSGITNAVASTVDGVAQCSFSRTANIVKILGGNNVSFDLVLNRYHVLQAIGSYFAFGLDLLFPHDTNQRFSTGPYSFGSASSLITFSSRTTAESTTTLPTTSNPFTDSCGITKGCFHDPPFCTLGNSDCMFASWTFNSQTDTVDFELVGQQFDDYVAIAFAPRPEMAYADMYFCTSLGVHSGEIGRLYISPTISTLPNGVTLNRLEVVDEVVRCSFSRPLSITKTIEGEAQDFDLASSSYYLLFATGSIISEQGPIMAFHRSRGLSEFAIDFSFGYAIEDSVTSALPAATTEENPFFSPITNEGNNQGRAEMEGSASPELTDLFETNVPTETTTPSSCSTILMNRFFVLLFTAVVLVFSLH